MEKALGSKQAIVITGMRRTGKTTAVKYLLEKTKSTNKIYLDLERVEVRAILNEPNYGNIVKALELEGLDFKNKAYIALDEIQLVQNIPSVIKYLYDTYSVKFIVTGSSSFYLKNHFSESMAGRKRVFEIFPLDFEEYLRFKEFQINLPPSKFNNTPLAFYNKLNSAYNEFILFGGFPEVVLINNNKEKKILLHDIVKSYLSLDIKFLADFTVTDELYKLIKLLTARVGSRLDYTKLGAMAGIDRKKVKDYLLFFEQTYLIHQVNAYSKNADKEIVSQKKLYFSDTGILNITGQVSSGALLENAVALQLMRKGEVNYYTRKNGLEIDFILDNSIAIEVKETPSPSDLQTLKQRAELAGITKHYLVAKNFPNKNFKDFIWAGSIY